MAVAGIVVMGLQMISRGGIGQCRYLSKIWCSQIRRFIFLVFSISRCSSIGPVSSIFFLFFFFFFRFDIFFYSFFKHTSDLCFTLVMGFDRFRMEIYAINLGFSFSTLLLWLFRFIHSAFAPDHIEWVGFVPSFSWINSPSYFLLNRQTSNIFVLN